MWWKVSTYVISEYLSDKLFSLHSPMSRVLCCSDWCKRVLAFTLITSAGSYCDQTSLLVGCSLRSLQFVWFFSWSVVRDRCRFSKNASLISTKFRTDVRHLRQMLQLTCERSRWEFKVMHDPLAMITTRRIHTSAFSYWPEMCQVVEIRSFYWLHVELSWISTAA